MNEKWGDKSLHTYYLCVPPTKNQIPNTSPDIWFQINVNICVFIPEPFPSSPLCAPPGTPSCSRSTRGRKKIKPQLCGGWKQPGSEKWHQHNWSLRRQFWSWPTESRIWSGIMAPTCQSRPWMRHLENSRWSSFVEIAVKRLDLQGPLIYLHPVLMQILYIFTCTDDLSDYPGIPNPAEARPPQTQSPENITFRNHWFPFFGKYCWEVKCKISFTWWE